VRRRQSLCWGALRFIWGAWALLGGWREALASKGIPLDSHNQSFIAFLHHFFSGETTPVIMLGRAPLYLGWDLFSLLEIKLLGAAYSLFSLSLILAWMLHGRQRDALTWVCVLTALLITPGHLVWKTYFIFMLPLVVVIFTDLKKNYSWGRAAIVFVFFVMLNFSGYDFIGEKAAAVIESAAVFLWIHWALIVLALFPDLLRSRQLLPSRALGSS
jgi:hypothetical protein